MSLDFNLDEPHTCQNCGKHSGAPDPNAFWINITHNLGKMANEAGIYECLWRPDEHKYVTASDIIEKLKFGLSDLIARPDHFKQFNPDNNWGNYSNLVESVARILVHCQNNPQAIIRVYR